MIRTPKMKPKRIILLGILFITSLIIYKIVGGNVGSHNEKLILDMIQLSAEEMVQPDRNTVIQGPTKSMACENLGSPHYLLYMIISAPENLEQRQAIRTILRKYSSSWEQTIMDQNGDLYQRGSTIRALFFVGRTNDGSETTVLDLIQEAKDYGDMIIDNFFESYYNLTIKTLRMLKWVEGHCPRVPFLIKIDDDVYINVKNILNFLHNVTSSTAIKTDGHPGQDLIAGYKYNKIQKDNDPSSKWYTPPAAYEAEKFPDFVGGFCYILGSRARSQLYHGALKRKLFHLEDVFLTGFVRNELLLKAENNSLRRNEEESSLNLMNIPGIFKWWKTWQKLNNNCSAIQNGTIIHPVSPNELLCYHDIERHCRRDSWRPIILWC